MSKLAYMSMRFDVRNTMASKNLLYLSQIQSHLSALTKMTHFTFDL